MYCIIGTKGLTSPLSLASSILGKGSTVASKTVSIKPKAVTLSNLTSVPTRQKALSVIGGPPALNAMHAASVATAKQTSSNRLQLAMAVTSRHFSCSTPDDLQLPATAGMSVDDRTHLAFDLNNEDGPWAVAMSENSYAWAAISADDLGSLKVVQDFLSAVFGHLR